jgi:hypothetical protein
MVKIAPSDNMAEKIDISNPAGFFSAKNVSQNDASLVPINRDAFWSTAGG